MCTFLKYDFQNSSSYDIFGLALLQCNKTKKTALLQKRAVEKKAFDSEVKKTDFGKTCT